MKISVICPFYNEELVIAQATRGMIDRLHEQIKHDWELILVNDGSRDRSAEILEKSLDGLDSTRVRVIGYSRNRGRGHALKTGIDAATGDIIVTTEADGSWGHDIVARLVDIFCSYPETDMVVASVHLSGGGLINVPLSRVLLTKVGNLLIRTMISRDFTMYTGMTRAYRREVIQPLPITEYGKEFHLETLVKLSTLGFEIREIPATITWPAAKGKGKRKRKSSTNISRTVATHLQFALLGRPAQYFMLAAAVSLTASIVLISLAVFNYIVGGIAIFYALTGILMCVIAMLFTGFAGFFSQLRSVMRSQWAEAYGDKLPELMSGRKVRQYFPKDA